MQHETAGQARIDMIVPMLQRIQGDIAEIKKDTKRIPILEERFDAFAPYTTFMMGLHAQNKADAEMNAEEIAGIKKRLDALESAQS